VGLILLVIGSLLAWRLADRLLAPVLQTAATARAISESDLSQRVEVSGHDEVAELAHTFNEMLDRLQSAFADQRHFLDDVGHELRTPLTIVRGHLELLNEATPAEREHTLALVLDELDRMTRLVGELMVLAQSHRPDFITRQVVNAGELVARVHEKASVLGRRAWRLEMNSAGSVSIDGQRITQAMLQLVTNAVNHTNDGDQILLGGGRLGPASASPAPPRRRRRRPALDIDSGGQDAIVRRDDDDDEPLLEELRLNRA
jgi:two-component system, OmpR family, sensor kinase